jgi:cytochrome P450
MQGSGPALLDYDPFSAAAMTDPYPLYRELRATHPMFPLPRYDAFALSRFQDVWGVIEDAARFSIAEGPVFSPEVVSHPGDASTLEPWQPARSFASWDPPAHTGLRQALHAHFRRGAVAGLEATARRIVRERLAALCPRGRFDVVGDLASPVAVGVSCQILGLPPEDGPRLARWSHRSQRRAPGRAGMSEDGLTAQAELHAYMVEHVRQRRAAPAPALAVIEALVGAELEGRRLSDPDVATQLVTLFVGGAETVPKILAGGVHDLARHPDQRAALAADGALVPGAFEEMVRHQGVLQSIGRTAKTDLEIDGRRVRRGQRLFLLLQSANRDEREFEDPDRFDVRRRPRRHLGFGHGPHHCIGIHLARLEGRVVLEELLRRVPEWEIDAAGLERPPSDFQIGFTALPIEFVAR